MIATTSSPGLGSGSFSRNDVGPLSRTSGATTFRRWWVNKEIGVIVQLVKACPPLGELNLALRLVFARVVENCLGAYACD